MSELFCFGINKVQQPLILTKVLLESLRDTISNFGGQSKDKVAER